jgi:hypothetical protein
MDNDTIYKCDNRGTMQPDDPGYFIPVEAGRLSTDNPTFTYTGGRCFKNTKFTYSQSGDSALDIGDVTLTIDTESPNGLFCNDWFLFGAYTVQHVDSFYLSG